MTSITPYSIQPQGITCRALSNYNTYVSPFVKIAQILPIALPIMKYVISKIRPADQQPHDFQNNVDDARGVSWFKVFESAIPVVLAQLPELYYQSQCGHLDPEFQQKKKKSSLMLVKLIEAGELAKSYFQTEQQRSIIWLKSNYQQVYTQHAEGVRSFVLELAGCNLLKKYFPNDKKIENKASSCGSEAYFKMLKKDIATKKVDLSHAEESLINLWANFLEA